MAGRPSTYPPEVEEAIFARLCTGESLRHICSDDDLPHESTVRKWVMLDNPPGIGTRYACARNMGLDSQAEEIIEISDTCREGIIRKVSEKDGVTVEHRDMVDRARLQVDARKWLLSKMRPDKYGDRLQVAGDKDAPLEVNVSGLELLNSRLTQIAARKTSGQS